MDSQAVIISDRNAWVVETFSPLFVTTYWKIRISPIKEILSTCGHFTLEAVRLLTKKRKNEPDKEVDTDAYLAAIRKNEVAYQVKVADRTMNLRSARYADILFRKKYLAETEKYYLDFAKDSPLYEELKLAYETLRRDTDLERRSDIPVDIEAVEDNEPTSSYVAVQLFSREGEMVPFTCQIERKDIEKIRRRKRKLIPNLSVTAIPDDETRRYSSEEDYEKQKDKKDIFSIASQSILFRDTEKLDNSALITGVVRGIQGQFDTMTGVKVSAFLEVLGQIITLILDEEDYPDLEPGEESTNFSVLLRRRPHTASSPLYLNQELLFFQDSFRPNCIPLVCISKRQGNEKNMGILRNRNNGVN